MFTEVFQQLDPDARKVLQTLAVLGEPVPPNAVDHVLRPYAPDLESGPILKRLAAAKVVRQEFGRYSLGRTERAQALATLERGDLTDRFEAGEPLFTWFALVFRGAEYFRGARKFYLFWRTLEDLSPVLAEFNLLCQGQDYATAAPTLNEITPSLFRWGHYPLITELRQKLVDHLEDPQQAQINWGELGSAYSYLGQINRAIECQQRALEIAHESGDRMNEGVWLAELGNRYTSLGHASRAIDCYEQALGINREFGDRKAEGMSLVSLGTCFVTVGEVERAVGCYEQALTVARELGDRSTEGACLGNLGNIYTTLGFTERAIRYQTDAIAIARELGNPVDEGRRLGNLAEALIAVGRYAEAIAHLQAGLRIDEESGYARGKSYKGCALACAHLYSGDLAAARLAIEEARRHDTPQNNHNALTLLGLVAWRQSDGTSAHEAFRAALVHADDQLAHNPQNHDALDAKGLALCGLALCEPNSGLRHLSDATTAYWAARAINRSVGLVRHALRLFDELAKTDPSGRLKNVRPAIEERLPPK